jgi:hypothetical protein
VLHYPRFCHLGLRSGVRSRRRNSDMQINSDDEFLQLRFTPYHSTSYSNMQIAKSSFGGSASTSPTSASPDVDLLFPPDVTQNQEEEKRSIAADSRPGSHEFSPDDLLSPGSNLDSPGSDPPSPRSDPPSPGFNSLESKMRRKIKVSSMIRGTLNG